MVKETKRYSCIFCKSESASYPIIIPSEGKGYLCDECTKQIPEYTFIRCGKCRETWAIKNKEDLIMDSGFKGGLNKIEVEYKLITTRWIPIILTTPDCKECRLNYEDIEDVLKKLEKKE